MPSQIADRFIKQLQFAEATQNVEPLVALFAEDAELINLAMTEPLRGLNGTSRFWQRYLSVFDHIHSTFTNIIETGNTLVLEWTSAGALATGQTLTYRGISLLETNSQGQVQHFRTYYDSAVFLPQGAKQPVHERAF